MIQERTSAFSVVHITLIRILYQLVLISSNGVLERDLTGSLVACKKPLDYQAPHKKKYTGANQAPFLMNEINKEIMTRSKLRNKFLLCSNIFSFSSTNVCIKY